MNVISENDYLAPAQAVTGVGHRFTGDVTVQRIIGDEISARVRVSSVTFEPTARTFWHAHAGEQILHVTEGHGWIQKWGEEPKRIEPGDVVLFESGEKHWHGATADSAMTHIAIATASETGELGIDWLEEVSESQYADAVS